jgi:hypothetical protein
MYYSISHYSYSEWGAGDSLSPELLVSISTWFIRRTERREVCMICGFKQYCSRGSHLLGYDRGINRLECNTSLLFPFHEMMIKMKGKPLNLSSSKAKVQSKTTGGIQLWRILLSICAVHMREQCDSERQIYLEISTRLHVLSILQYEKKKKVVPGMLASVRLYVYIYASR